MNATPIGGASVVRPGRRENRWWIVLASQLPLEGITVLDFSQFMAGPVGTLRLADLGARVIKIERTGAGDLGRTIAFGGIEVDGTSLSFIVMNRNKESFAADLKDPRDLAVVRSLVDRADVVVQNFRPGVMERLGLGYETLRKSNPRLVYASVSGYGKSGPWAGLPGQDLLAQSRSGLAWLNGRRGDPPVPVGIAVADLLASCHVATGVLALLVRRGRTGEGGLVETSLLEGLLDLQLELVAAELNDNALAVDRAGEFGAHAFLGSPYGVFPTTDGHLALAMNPLPRIAEVLGIEELRDFDGDWSSLRVRDEINAIIAAKLRTGSSSTWLALLDAIDAWCAPVLTTRELLDSEAFRALEGSQVVRQSTSSGGATTALGMGRSPLRIDGEVLRSERGAPRIGEHTRDIARDLNGG